MKKLTKIQLVNWHFFSFQIIDIENNTLVSGENGSGKSTLLDALQYVLIGERNHVKFNIAANVNAKRSLESYMRCKIGAENKEFLRDQDVITHILLEFYDNVNKKYSIFGCVLELSRSNQLKEKFYFVENMKFIDNMCVENDQPKTQKQLFLFLRKYVPNFNFFDTKKQYQHAIGNYLNINVSKYIQMLPKALAFKPLNLQNFVFEFLLEPNPVNISSLKNSFKQLKKLELQIEFEKQKLFYLTNIIDADKKFIYLKEQIQIYQCLLYKVQIKKNNFDLDLCQSKREADKLSLKKLLFQKEKINLTIDTLNNKLVLLKSNDRKLLLNNLHKDLVFYENLEHTLNEKINFFRNQINQELMNLKRLQDLSPSEIYSDSINFISDFLNLGFSEIQVNFPKLKVVLEKLWNFISKEIINFNIQKNDSNKFILDLQKKILDKEKDCRLLSSVISVYPQHIQNLIEILNKKLSNFYSLLVCIRPLCELIDINDNLWRNAIEGFLGNRKFNLLIEENYFDQALKIYSNLPQSVDNNFYDIGLVNVAQIPFIKDNFNSLSTKISSDNKNALKYIRLLLSNIICELDPVNLKKHKTAITPDCLVYSQYTLRKINPKFYQFPYIGNNSIKMRENLILSEIQKFKSLLLQHQSVFNEYQEIIDLLNKSKLSNILISDNFNLYSELLSIKVKKQKISQQITQLSSDLNLRNVEDSLIAVMNQKNNNNEQLERILFKIADLNNNLNNYELETTKIKIHLSELNQKLNILMGKNISNSIEDKINVHLYQYYQQYNDNYDLILNKINDYLKNIEQQKLNQQMDLINQIQIYLQKYNISDIESRLENLEYFYQEYNSANAQNLSDYEQEAKELTYKTEIIFKEEFINKLKESIDNTKQQIHKLNQLLIDRPFGNDNYQIIIKPSNDPDYKKYYDVISSYNNDSKNELFERGLMCENTLLEELFDKIISFEEGYEDIAESFLDYRNYMTYDIQIKDINNNYSFFSKIFREKSGGETQVPFYIIMSICFEQLNSVNDNQGCLVLFDEAFNNMDEARIEGMMRFFNSLKIQFIMAIPPQRIADISPYVQTNLIIIKDNNHVIVENFTRNILNL
ncbi:MAG: ATP-binding protein [Pigeon pea little leaf phytoplasma]|nr:ATP-binding protein [Pigeon pea little leaf phytoplasma]MDV3189089.1 ATP-binding protein [Pigeon pea little leaf phytoplasma]